MAQISSDTNVWTVALIWTRGLAWWIAYAFWTLLRYLFVAIVFTAHLLYRPVAFLLQPVFHFSRFVLACVIVPSKIAARFEILYIYLGVAAIVGILGGLIIGGVCSRLQKLSKPPLGKANVRTAREYREQKRKDKPPTDTSLFSPRHQSPTAISAGYRNVSDGSLRRSNFLGQPILEEEDSDL